MFKRLHDLANIEYKEFKSEERRLMESKQSHPITIDRYRPLMKDIFDEITFYAKRKRYIISKVPYEKWRSMIEDERQVVMAAAIEAEKRASAAAAAIGEMTGKERAISELLARTRTEADRKEPSMQTDAVRLESDEGKRKQTEPGKRAKADADRVIEAAKRAKEEEANRAKEAAELNLRKEVNITYIYDNFI